MHKQLAGNASLDVQWEQSDYIDILFGDWEDPEKQYLKLSPPNELIERLDGYLETYNVSSTNAMNLVFFSDAIYHLTRATRILRSQRGNALLVGVGGSGRSSLAGSLRA